MGNDIADAILSTLNERGAAFRQATDIKSRRADRLYAALEGVGTGLGSLPSQYKAYQREKQIKVIDDAIAGHFAGGGNAEGLPQTLSGLTGSIDNPEAMHYLATKSAEFDTANRNWQMDQAKIDLDTQREAHEKVRVQREGEMEERQKMFRDVFPTIYQDESNKARMGYLTGGAMDHKVDYSAIRDRLLGWKDPLTGQGVDPQIVSAWYEKAVHPDQIDRKELDKSEHDKMELEQKAQHYEDMVELKQRELDIRDATSAWRKRLEGEKLNQNEKLAMDKMEKTAAYRKERLGVLRDAAATTQWGIASANYRAILANQEHQDAAYNKFVLGFMGQEAAGITHQLDEIEKQMDKAVAAEDEDALKGLIDRKKELARQLGDVTEKASKKAAELHSRTGGGITPPAPPVTGGTEKQDLGTKGPTTDKTPQQKAQEALERRRQAEKKQ